MLNTLVETVHSTEDVLELCEQLEKINGSADLIDTLMLMKQGVDYVQM